MLFASFGLRSSFLRIFSALCICKSSWIFIMLAMQESKVSDVHRKSFGSWLALSVTKTKSELGRSDPLTNWGS